MYMKSIISIDQGVACSSGGPGDESMHNHKKGILFRAIFIIIFIVVIAFVFFVLLSGCGCCYITFFLFMVDKQGTLTRGTIVLVFVFLPGLDAI
jgi:hypothetical protein